MIQRHKDFADAYLADPNLNATRAYRQVYPRSGEEAARRSASELLTRDDVQAYISERMQERAQRTGITQDFVLGGLKEVAERCMQRHPVMVGKGKDRKQAKEYVTTEDGREVEAHVFEFDSAGANRALELLGKHLGIFSESLGDDEPPVQRVEIVVKDGRKA